MLREPTEQRREIRVNGVGLEGVLGMPREAQGIVLFAHGSGSSRLSPRNAFVAGVLRRRRLATLLTDLLTASEDETYGNRFDIDLLTERLGGVARWIQAQSEARSLPLGLFGASTGAACALRLAAQMGNQIFAIVSRGGRPDLADPFLERVKAPTLLIVGGHDELVLRLNRLAYAKLRDRKELLVIPGATHLFEEPGTLKSVADAAAQWFTQHLPATGRKEGVSQNSREKKQ